VHQDGLVHVSAMSYDFVKDPRDVVKPGDIVRVKVLDVDLARKRISLTLRLDDEAEAASRERRQGGSGGRDGGRQGGRRQDGRRGQDRGRGRGAPQPGGALAEALRKAGLDKGLDALRDRGRR